MRRALLAGLLVAGVVSGPSGAQVVATLGDFHDKPVISETDRQQIRAWIGVRIGNLIAGRDADLRRMVAARKDIVREGSLDPSWSEAFNQAYGEEVSSILEKADPRAVSQQARVNLMMTVAQLQRLENAEILMKSLTEDPYPAARYWAARGLSMVAPRIVEMVMPRLEQQIAERSVKAFETETNELTLYYLFETLGRFDHEKAHDVLAAGVAKVASRLTASGPTGAYALGGAVRALQKAHSGDVRPEARQRLLSAYAALCAWVMPPVADPNLMPALNASLEQITGQKVGFASTYGEEAQKLALLEWVEKFVREKQIPVRPSLPPAVDKAAARASR